jgi:hypothetical protein
MFNPPASNTKFLTVPFKASHFFGGSGGEMRFHDPLACGVGSY